MKIESVNNEKIKIYSKLKEKKYRDQMNLFIIEGKHLIEEAIKKNIVVDIFSMDGSMGIMVSENVMKKLSSLNNIPECIAICKKISEKEITGNILVLDNIQDPGNLGTIIRSAVAFNIDTIIASENTVDIYNMKTIRASEGMIFNINYLKRNIDNLRELLKNKYTIYTTNVEKGKSINDIEIKLPYAIIMGNEGSGVRKNISNQADEHIIINMNEKCESLNVGVATSIILYEFNSRK